MEVFYRNLHIVLEFAARVELYGNREPLLASLKALRFEEAHSYCTRGLMGCRRDLEGRGLLDNEIRHVSSYRRLLQLAEMIEDLAGASMSDAPASLAG